MSKHLSSLLVGLLLLVAAACSKKKDPEPDPNEVKLEGWWDYVRTTKTGIFGFTHTLIWEEKASPGIKLELKPATAWIEHSPYTIQKVITSDCRQVNDTLYVQLRRADNTVTPTKFYIVGYSKNELHLQSYGPYSNIYGNIVYDYYYTR